MILIYVITNDDFMGVKKYFSLDEVVLIHNTASPGDPEWLRESQALLPVCHCALMIEKSERITDLMSNEIDIAKAMDVKVFYSIKDIREKLLDTEDVKGYIAGMKHAYLEFIKHKEEERKDIGEYVDASSAPEPEPEPINAEGHIIKFPGAWNGSE